MKTIPGIFFSHDGYLSAAIFTLRQYAKTWPDCPIQFLVPVNSGAAQKQIRHEAPPGLHIKFVRSGTPIKATFAALDEAAGDAEWILWCSSDRYPTLAAPDTLNRIAADLATRQGEAAPASQQSIRFVHWREIGTADRNAEPVVIGGEQFHPAPMSRIGFWQPQFLRRSWYSKMVAGLPEQCTLKDVQDQVGRMIKTIHEGPLISAKPLMKVEEPIRKGLATMNYAARQWQRGGDIDGLALEAVTVAYSSIGNRQVNTFWQSQGINPAMELKLLPKAAPIHVVSPGGVGSKYLVGWLYPDEPVGSRSKAHSHRRLPPVRVRQGERFIYVFGDPRNILLSIFNRRQARHERHGFQDLNAVRDEPAPDFAMRHARNLQVFVETMTADWDLAEYLAQQQDVFRFEEHFDFWLSTDADFEVVFVRYETLQKRAGELAAYLGIERTPLQFRPRASDWTALDERSQRRINKMYGPLARRLEALPDLFSVKDGKATTLEGAALRFESV
jgi:hypothetical protein